MSDSVAAPETRFSMDRSLAFAAGMTAVFMIGWQARTSGAVSFLNIVTILALVLVVGAWGRLTLWMTGIDQVVAASGPAVAIAGITSLGALFMVGRSKLPIGPATLFLLLAAIGLLGARRLRGRFARPLESDAMTSLVALFLSLCAATFWVQHYFPPTETTDDAIVFKPIRDNFTHTNHVLQFSYPGPMNAAGRYGMAGDPMPFYHMASYSFPAVVAVFAGETAYDTTIAVWLPLAMAIVGWGAYVLGAAAFGPRVGLWATVAVIVIPDPSFWTLGVWTLGFYAYSFHRFLQIAPANGYGAAVAALGLAGIVAGVGQRKIWPILGGWAIVGLSMIFKAQVFVAAFPLASAFAGGSLALLWRREIASAVVRRPYLTVVLVAAVAIGAAALALGPLRGRTPILQLEIPPGARLAEFLFNRTVNDTSAHPLAQLTVEETGIVGLGLRKMLVLWTTFRLAVVPLAIVTLWTLLTPARWRLFDLVAFVALSLYLSYALFLAPNFTGHTYGNPWDLQFVPFGWCYLVLGVWLVGKSIDLIREIWPSRPTVPAWVAILLLAATYMIGRSHTDDWQTEQYWAYMPVPRELVACAEFIRTHAAPADRIQDSEDDAYFTVESLAERRAYAGWPVVGSFTARTTDDDVFKSRLAEHEKARGANTAAAVSAFAQQTGVRWYVLHPETTIAWPKDVLDKPAFTSGRYRVYDLASLAGR